MSSEASFSTNDSSSDKKPQQIENLSPLAVGDQRLNRHLGYFSGTMINGNTLNNCVLLLTL